jgi:hypothetical protein
VILKNVHNFRLELFFQHLSFPIEEAYDYNIYFLFEGMLAVQIHALIMTSSFIPSGTYASV